MSIASRITSIEEHIGDIYSVVDYIKDTTGINKNLINIPTYLIKGYLDILNNGTDTLYNSFPKVSGIGSNLSLTPTYKAPIKLNEIQGDTLQNGTPTPSSPVPIETVTGLQNVEVCGKNLFNKANVTENYRIGSDGLPYADNNCSLSDFIGVLPSTTYSVSVSMDYRNCVAFYDINKNYISPRIQSGTSFTTGSTTHFIRMATEKTNLNALQIEKGTATTYESYKGNTYEVNLGKNLFDKNNANIINGYFDSNNTSIVSHEYNKTIYILCNPNTTYTIQKYKTSQFDIGYTTQLPTIGTQVSGIVRGDRGTYDGSIVSYSITTGNNAKYLVVRIINTNTDSGTTLENLLSSIQIEKGSQATSYSPYFTPIELNKIGDYQDSIKKSTGKNLCFNVTKPSNANLKFFINKSISKTFTISFTTNEALNGNSLYLEVDGTGYGNIGGITASANTRVEKTYTLSDTDYQAIQNGTNIDLLLYKNGANFNIPNDGMVENNSTATSYEPYGKVWYITKNIGKVVFNGSETWTRLGASTTPYKYYTNKSEFVGLPTTTGALSTHFVYDGVKSNSEAYRVFFFNMSTGQTTSNGNITFTTPDITSKDNFATWLTSNNVKVLYSLKTPEYEVITNTELIEQLESLYNAKSKNGTTNITITSQDLAMIMSVSVIKGDA